MSSSRNSIRSRRDSSAAILNLASVVTILDKIDHAITLYDKDLRLVFCNQAYLDLYELTCSDIRIGMGFADIVRLLAARGEFGDVDPERQIEFRRKKLESDTDQFHIRHRPNGISIAVYNARLSGGGVVSTITEITDLHRTEMALQEKTALLQMTQDHMAQGICVFDRNLRLTNFNRRWEEMFNLPPGIARLGTTYEDYYRYEATRGEFGPEDPEKLVQLRLARLRSDRPYFNEVTRRDGKVIAIWRVPSPDGGFIATFTDVTEKKLAEREVENKKRMVEAIIDKMAQGVVVFDLDFKLLSYNENFRQMFGIPAGFLEPGMDIEKLIRFRYERAMIAGGTRTESVEQLIDQGRVATERGGERRLPDGRHYIYNRKIVPGIGIVTTYTDVTDLKKVEMERSRLSEQLHQSQKMDSIGQMAGGIAHDFNNFLMVIDGYARQAAADPQISENSKVAIATVLNTVAAAADLNRQLLMFSRRQPVTTKAVAVNKTLGDIAGMLRPLLGHTITFAMEDASNEASIQTDPTLFTQAIINLALNARDAMPEGGVFRIAVKTCEVGDDMILRHPHLTQRNCVRIDVTDTGHGMSDETLKQIYNPFFTTKEQGKGTGLGLAMVYGFVTQCHGAIDVRSAPGSGTAFSIYLPVSEKAPDIVQEVDGRSLVAHGETILLVEDNDAVRHLVETTLQRYGYSILAAGDALEALEIEADHVGRIDLLLSDVVMPNMSGGDLAAVIKQARPDIKVVLMTGNPGRGDKQREFIPQNTPVLQKPIAPEALAATLRDALDRPEILAAE